MSAITPLVEAVAGGSPALLWSGRSPRDLDLDGEIRPLIEILRRTLRERLGMALLTYSKATGLLFDAQDVREARMLNQVEEALRASRLIGSADLDLFMRNLWLFLRTPSGGTWPDGRPLRFCLFIEFAEDLFPCETYRGEEEVKAGEWLRLLGQSLALRRAGNAIIIHAPHDGMIDARVRTHLHTIRLAQPDRDSKRSFLEVLWGLYTKASKVEGLDDETIAYLTANTPHWSLLEHVEASHKRRHPIEVSDLIARRAADVLAVSEGLLAALEGERTTLAGWTVEHAWQILRQIAVRLRQGDPQTPQNVLLAGAPGTGKTVLAIRLAAEAGVNAYRLHSPKAGIVGATERNARLEFEILHEWAPNIAFTDEVTETLTTERPEHDLDAGASRAVIGALLAYLGDETRRGRTIFLGATNCPWRMADALRSRFIVIPVLMPLAEDYPSIIATLVQRTTGRSIPPDVPALQEAAGIFYAKGTSPRHILQALDNAYLVKGQLGAQEVKWAAEDFCGDTGAVSAEYSDLWAIKLTTSRAFFPWSQDPSRYPYPSYLRGIVDPQTGEVQREQLNRRIEELGAIARV